MWDEKEGAYYNDTEFYGETYYATTPTVTNQDVRTAIKFKASLYSAIFGASATVQPKSLLTQMLIKY